MKIIKLSTILVIYIVVGHYSLSVAEPMGTAFTYQGRLLDINEPAKGIYDLRFVLFGSPMAEDLLDVISIENVQVSDGFFTVELDFLEDIFDGNGCWLEISLRPGESIDPNDWNILTPRQRITPTPYALYAKSGTPGPQGEQGPKGDTGDPGPQGPPGPGDNLGDHTAMQNIRLNENYLSSDGGNWGINLSPSMVRFGGDSGVCIIYDESQSKGKIGVYQPSFNFWPIRLNGITTELSKLEVGQSVSIGNEISGCNLFVSGSANISMNQTGEALLVNGDEAIWYDGTEFSWGFDGIWNYFSDGVCIGGPPANPSPHKLVVNGTAYKTQGGTTWAVPSDARLKDIHGQYQVGLSEVCQLEPMRYNYKQGNSMGLSSYTEAVGVVAQEVRQVIPEAVEENSDGYLMVNSDPIIWAMLNAIKELKVQKDSEIDKLQKENAVLTKQLAEFEKNQSDMNKRLKVLEVLVSNSDSDWKGNRR